jgi:hypothetical protein
MKPTILVLGCLLLLFVPASALAKGQTVKITIEGAGLRVPIEITDPRVLVSFNVRAGGGTTHADPGNGASFIIDWSRGAIREHPAGPLYKISFWTKEPKEKLVYVVFYQYDRASRQGYVYLPGRQDEWYRLNTQTIYRFVEGNWLHARSEWDKIAIPLISGHA